MDPRLLHYYNRELQHVREMAGEFAQEFPKIAGRLGLDGFECADPYVERLLEGFAFLTARIQLKLDAEFPRFTQHLLECVYPHYLAPVPSMAVVQFQPDYGQGALGTGFPLERGLSLHALPATSDLTTCEYRTAHDVTLWPLEIAEAAYYASARDVATLAIPEVIGTKAALRLRLKLVAGQRLQALPLDRLSIYLRGSDQHPMQLYEHLFANALGVVLRPAAPSPGSQQVVDPSHIRQVGFEPEQALLPLGPRSFDGYRLLQEYFAFAPRFLFFELAGLAPAISRCTGPELDVIVCFDRIQPALENTVGRDNFALFCTPAINLFPRRLDRIHLDETSAELQVVPDRTRPLDYEVHQITRVVGHGTGTDTMQEFAPLYASDDRTDRGAGGAYYTIRRLPRVLSERQRKHGPRSRYVGSEVFLTLVDPRSPPYSSELRQLAVEATCTNRDLPLALAVGTGSTDFTLDTAAPVRSTRCLSGPSAPRPPFPEGEAAWRVIKHLSLNYLSLVGEDGDARHLRGLLALYGDTSDAATKRQVEGVRSVQARPVTRRLPVNGPATFARGIELTLTLDDKEFEGTGSFLLGAVLDKFFAKYVSINSFTETVVTTVDRGQVMRWPTRTGLRHTI